MSELPSFKVVIVGDFGVGKSSLLKQLTLREFSHQSGTTIGVEFKEHRFGNGVLQLWDIAGQQFRSSMTKQYYRYSAAAVVVVDVTKPASFDVARDWQADVLSKIGASQVGLAEEAPIPIFLFANKADLLAKDSELPHIVGQFAQDNRFTDWMLTTATDFTSVETAFLKVLEALHESCPGCREGKNPGSPSALLRKSLRGPSTQTQQKKCCGK